VRDASPPGSALLARVGSRMKPGARGTRKLLGQYGDLLVCVRYRYDELRGKRFKTVELLVEEADWSPPRRPFVLLELRSWETQLRERVKRAGGATSVSGDFAATSPASSACPVGFVQSLPRSFCQQKQRCLYLQKHRAPHPDNASACRNPSTGV
jgi:hypothetical protein